MLIHAQEQKYKIILQLIVRDEGGASAVPRDGPGVPVLVHGAGLHHPDEPAGWSGGLGHPGTRQVRQAPSTSATGQFKLMLI